MARERVYRHDVRCRRCGSNWMPKDGRTRGHQVYKCGECKEKQVAAADQPRFQEHAKRRAVQMRMEGASMTAARAVGASVTSVSGWLKEEGRIRASSLSEGHTSVRAVTNHR